MHMVRTTDVARAVEVLRRGRVVAYATDTLYGLAVDPRSDEAVARLFAVKGRQAGHAVPLIAANVGQAAAAAQFNGPARRLAQDFWPGPLSLILDSKPGLCRALLAADGSVAVRVPDHDDAQSLAGAFGFCITSTSANPSGMPPTISPDDVARSLGERVDLLLDSGPAPGSVPSTIVDARPAVPRLVRAGAVEWERVLRSLQ